MECAPQRPAWLSRVLPPPPPSNLPPSLQAHARHAQHPRAGEVQGLWAKDVRDNEPRRLLSLRRESEKILHSSSSSKLLLQSFVPRAPVQRAPPSPRSVLPPSLPLSLLLSNHLHGGGGSVGTGGEGGSGGSGSGGGGGGGVEGDSAELVEVGEGLFFTPNFPVLKDDVVRLFTVAVHAPGSLAPSEARALSPLVFSLPASLLHAYHSRAIAIGGPVVDGPCMVADPPAKPIVHLSKHRIDFGHPHSPCPLNTRLVDSLHITNLAPTTTAVSIAFPPDLQPPPSSAPSPRQAHRDKGKDNGDADGDSRVAFHLHVNPVKQQLKKGAGFAAEFVFHAAAPCVVQRVVAVTCETAPRTGNSKPLQHTLHVAVTLTVQRVVFGVAMEAIEAEPYKTSHVAVSLPRVLVVMWGYVVQSGALDLHGVFREGAGEEAMATARAELNADAFRACEDKHAVPNLIKCWFRELPRALLADVDATQLCAVEEEQSAVDVVRLVGKREREVLTWLLDAMCQVTLHEKQNDMRLHDLAIQFGPTLVNTSNVGPLVAVQVTQKAVLMLYRLARARMRDVYGN